MNSASHGLPGEFMSSQGFISGEGKSFKVFISVATVASCYNLSSLFLFYSILSLVGHMATGCNTCFLSLFHVSFQSSDFSHGLHLLSVYPCSICISHSHQSLLRLLFLSINTRHFHVLSLACSYSRVNILGF